MYTSGNPYETVELLNALRRDGLLSLKDHIEAFGGRMFLPGVSGEGTSLRVELPFIATNER